MNPIDIARVFKYKYTIILPTHNEVENIGWMIDNIASSMKGFNWEIVIVDDNSPDGTFVKALDKSKEGCYLNRVKVTYRCAKYGLGSAYKHGMKHATGDWIVLMDADRSHNPKCIPMMIREQMEKEADIVNASRYSHDGGVIGWSFHRQLISKTANFIAAILLGLKRKDMTGSFRLYNVEVINELLKNIKSNGYAFQMEMICRAEKKGYKIVDFPYIFVDRCYGKSKLGIKEIIGFIWALMFLFLYRI
jgi:dolichol-phosphate mannosyltransferase